MDTIKDFRAAIETSKIGSDKKHAVEVDSIISTKIYNELKEKPMEPGYYWLRYTQESLAQMGVADGYTLDLLEGEGGYLNTMDDNADPNAYIGFLRLRFAQLPEPIFLMVTEDFTDYDGKGAMGTYLVPLIGSMSAVVKDFNKRHGINDKQPQVISIGDIRTYRMKFEDFKKHFLQAFSAIRYLMLDFPVAYHSGCVGQTDMPGAAETTFKSIANQKKAHQKLGSPVVTMVEAIRIGIMAGILRQVS